MKSRGDRFSGTEAADKRKRIKVGPASAPLRVLGCPSWQGGPEAGRPAARRADEARGFAQLVPHPGKQEHILKSEACVSGNPKPIGAETPIHPHLSARDGRGCDERRPQQLRQVQTLHEDVPVVCQDMRTGTDEG